MPIYKQTTEITNIDDLLSSVEKDIEEVYFGDKNIFTVWGEYEGTLPATINANGDDMRQYQVYGATGGVGDRTENLFDKTAKNPDNGFINNSYLAIGGSAYNNSSYYVSEYIEIENTTNITFAFASMPGVYTCFYDSEKQITGPYDGKIIQNVPMTVTVPSSAKYMRMSVSKSYENAVCVVEGSTAPASFVPFGYKLDMDISDGTSATTTPIYIGDDPLGEDEYVDYQSQKVYRRTAQLWDYEKITVTVGERYGIIVPNGQYSIRNDTNRIIYAVLDYGISGENVMVACVANSTATLTVQSLQTLNVRFYIGGTDVLRSGVTIVAGSTIPSVEIPYLQPEDPPVPLPALPTCEGETVVDYSGSGTAPEKVMFKYRKKNF